jgi:hypothetical protein
MDIVQILGGTGQGFSLYAILVEDDCPVTDFIDSLDERYQKQVVNLFQQIATVGLPKNKERFRPIEDQIYELKTRGGVRILCFFAGSLLPRSLILTHGFFKPHRKILKRETEKAVAWRDDYESSKINIVS